MSILTHYRIVADSLLIRFQSPRRVLSSAVLCGGFCNASFILNHWVKKEFAVDNDELRLELDNQPEQYLRNLARQLECEEMGVGLMTAVNIPKKLIVLHETFEDIWVEGFFTVGVGNAVRAGDPATYAEAHPAGTINIILITNARLSDPAMVEAVQVAAEAKTAVLLESGIKSRVSSMAATGTGTDCTVIVSGHDQPVRYAGTHTKMGELVGRVVFNGVLKGLGMCRP